VDEEEGKNAPAGFDTVKAVGKDLAGLTYRIQVSPLDCTGCGNCVEICPSKQKALVSSYLLIWSSAVLAQVVERLLM
jgi:pyruvate-ferredoxin/flavodoxin oxidoreductase